MLKNNESIVMEFGDGLEVSRDSKVIDISKASFFDELEYEVWEILLKYMEAFNIKVDKDEVDFYTVKEIQECILKQFEYAGFKFKYREE